MSSKQIFYTTDESETRAIGRLIVASREKGAIVALSGPLGSGKSVVVKGMAEALQIDEAIVSPTFTLVQEYEGRVNLTHLDLYRIGSVEEFEGMGGEEMLYNPGFVAIEWAERINAILPSGVVRLTIAINADGRREISVEGL
ncbi:MAG: tRNA (adenosine(37)-N6)-threonylcarbamoyltransferase complex ATPase subunit type 1 TsaE [Sphaerochaetaceae bacterium]